MEKTLKETLPVSAYPIVPVPTGPSGPARTTMNGKPVLWRKAKTVLSANEAFQEKLLCDGLTMNSGDLCTFSCSFCYVESQIWKLVHGEVKEFNQRTGQSRVGSEVVVRREKAVEVLKQQIRKKDDRPDDRRVVYGSTLVDVAGNLELLRETAELVTWILDNTHWQIRLLSKSHLLHRLVKDRLVPDRKKEGAADRHHQRIIFGFSTGTFDDRLAAAFESGTARVSKRLEALHWLQDEGFRTFGMVCPSLPQEDYEAFAREAVHWLRPERMEHVWAEVINVRGESFERTRQALIQGGFSGQADRLAEVSLGTQSKVAWEQYARATFEAHRKQLPEGKLRFLQYVNKANLDWWKARRPHGAVLLGATAKENGVCSTERSAPEKFYPVGLPPV
jgi:DNA repair photolyase